MSFISHLVSDLIAPARFSEIIITLFSFYVKEIFGVLMSTSAFLYDNHICASDFFASARFPETGKSFAVTI